MSPTRRPRRRARPWLRPLAAGATAAAVGAVLIAHGGGTQAIRPAADSAGALTASYQAQSSWGTGYTGQYTITNGGSAAVSGWTLSFRLPSGTSVSSLWNGSYAVSGGTVTVTADSWAAGIAPGGTQSVGFVTTSSGSAGAPSGCLINGAACQSGAPAPTSSPTASASPAPPAAGTASFAPYVDTSLFPPFSLTATAQATGVKQFNLAFVVAGGSGGCTPEWGGVTAIGSDPVAAQIGALRAMGGDVRISFGGADGSELATTCTSVSQLQAAYQQVITAFGVSQLDFDIEGAAVANTAANSRRGQALAALQAQNKGLQISFTLPVLPSGLTSDGVAVVTGAVQAGVQLAAVNVMAMDYGDGAAPNPAGNMGTFAIDAATATDAQVATAMGISDAAAWPKIAVTPMIGVNDTSDEIFTVASAQQLVAFAASKHLAWLSMWSAARDQQCPGGAQPSAEPTCSSIAQSPDAFMTALGAF
jgi:hypothetical protein